MDGGLRLSGAPRRELPDRDVVLRGRRRLELVGSSGDELVEVVADHEDISEVGASGGCLAHAIDRGRVRDDDARTRVVEVVGVVLGLQERVRLGRDRADLLGAVPERDELDRVAEDQEDALLRTDAELTQDVAALVRQARELGVRCLAVRPDQRGAVASALLDVAVDEPAREVELPRDVVVGQDRATSRTSSTSISVSVS
jgi:hypothetical protein